MDLLPPTHMLQEIGEQPAVVARLLTVHSPDANANVKLDSTLSAALAQTPYILWGACGSSYQTARLGAYALAQLAAQACAVHPAHELVTLGRAPWRSARLAIVVSQSGETQDTLEALGLAHAHACPSLCVVNAPQSTMARTARWCLNIQAGPELAIPSTKGFMAQSVAALLLAAGAAQAQKAPEGPVAEVVAALHNLPKQLTKLLEAPPALEALAQSVATARQVIFLGRGADGPIASEGGLKLMESAYVPAQGFAMGEFKHGPMAGLQASTPVVAIVSPSPWVGRTRQNLDQVRACGAPVWWIGPPDLPEMAGFDGGHLSVPYTHNLVSPLLAVVLLQLLAHRVAQLRQLNPDQPRHLVKSVQDL